MRNRRRFTDYEKKTVYAKCNGKCALCGKPVRYGKMTIDHKKPLSIGGTNDMSNLQLACRRCNLMKSNCTIEEFIERAYRITAHNWKAIISMAIGR